MFLGRSHLVEIPGSQIVVMIALFEVAQPYIDLPQSVINGIFLRVGQLKRIAQQQSTTIPGRSHVQLALLVAGIGQIDEDVGHAFLMVALHTELVSAAVTSCCRVHITCTHVDVAFTVGAVTCQVGQLRRRRLTIDEGFDLPHHKPCRVHLGSNQIGFQRHCQIIVPRQTVVRCLHTLHCLCPHFVRMSRNRIAIQSRKAFERPQFGRLFFFLPGSTGCQCQQAKQQNDMVQAFYHLMVTIVAPNPYS